MSKRHPLQCVAVLAFIALVANEARAQTPAYPAPSVGAPSSKNSPQTASPTGTKVMRASRLSGSISIDGKLDEPAWAAAVPATDFMQSYPNVGAKPTDSTSVRVLYDDDALYVGVRMFDSDPKLIAAQLARRDATGIYSDWLHVMIDSYRDRRTSFRFSVNPRGVQKDVLEYNDNNGEDVNWDAVWQVATTVDTAGWTAEYRIPFSQLRFSSVPKGTERLWGFQVMRDVARRNERDSWSPWKQTDPGFVSFEGDLAGIVDIPTPRRLEIMPYVSGKLTRAPGDAANPFYRANDTKPSAGADLKYGLPNGLTLTATANPDFGQVEVDPAVVNLSAYETFFPEKRPFFVEGSNLFNIGSINGGPSFGSQQIFYSRRIGRPPQRFPDGQFVDAPDATTILGAGKLTGKVGAWSVGVLNALTSEENARVLGANNLESSTPVEPLSNYFVGRVSHDFRGGNTIISVGGTAVNRDLADTVFKNLLRSSADVGSLDFEHRWAKRQWSMTGAFSESRINGSRSVIENAQTTSARYYQRPDADYLSVDTSANSLSGYSAKLGLNKSGTWSLSATAKAISPGFEVNDLGFMGRVDYLNFGSGGSYNNFTPSKLLRSYSLFAGTNHAWNYGGNKIWTSYFNQVTLNFTNLWSVYAGTEYDPGAIDDRLTRGGPLGLQPTQYNAWTQIVTDARKSLSYNLYASYFGDVDHGYDKELSLGLDMRPSSSIHVTVTPGLSLFHNTIQYVRAAIDPLATSTYGKRYVFGNIYQTTLSATTRVEWTLSPLLSFQLYAQPFASAGRFNGFKELATPATRNYLVYGRDNGSTISKTTDPASGKTLSYDVDPDGSGPAPAFSIGNPDFRTHSLRGNAVVRWEYRPGSAIFFVWQQERSDFLPFEGDFRASRDTREIFGRPSNVFLVKATYWFAR
ncbi:MAG TPA: DUF5916 domain-containing protein [Gemmatimonadaceae bacterium]|nr:DUF5916 domain-containing protein [Gemmatimonadaceae bacterium]